MTDDELSRALSRAYLDGPASHHGQEAWLVVARRARELLTAPAQPVKLPPEPPPGFVRNTSGSPRYWLPVSVCEEDAPDVEG